MVTFEVCFASCIRFTRGRNGWPDIARFSIKSLRSFTFWEGGGTCDHICVCTVVSLWKNGDTSALLPGHAVQKTHHRDRWANRHSDEINREISVQRNWWESRFSQTQTVWLQWLSRGQRRESESMGFIVGTLHPVQLQGRPHCQSKACQTIINWKQWLFCRHSHDSGWEVVILTNSNVNHQLPPLSFLFHVTLVFRENSILL